MALNPTFKNNNPGNIRFYSRMKNVIGRSENGFAIFSNKYYGIQAMRNLLQGYIRKGYNTLEKILNRYAPPVENKTSSYIEFVSRRTGIPKNRIITPDELEKIIPAMVKMETGKELGTLDLFLSRHIDKMPLVILGALLLIKKM